MELFKLLFNVMFILAFVSKKMFITEVCAEINWRLPNNEIPKNYTIWLDVDVEKNIFYGKSNVNITIYKQTHGITLLHSTYLDIIKNTTTIENIGTSKGTKYIASSVSYFNQMEVIVIYFNYDLTPGNYTLNMEYMGIISDMSGSDMGGFFKTSFINKKGDREWFVATRNWATGIRRTFPCWDEPGIEATFKIIVQHHRNYTALSNTHYRKIVRVNDDIVETHFEETPAMPAYLVAIVLCNLPETIVFKNTNLRGKQQFEDDLIFTSRVIANVTNQLNISSMQQHFAVPGLIDDGMAKWGLILYRDEDIIYDKERDNIARKMKITCLIGLKITRQWLSSTTSPSWWSHFWLNEGIATVLFASKIIDKIIPNSRMSDLFVIQILQESLYLDGQGIMEPLTSWEQEGNMISDINSIFSFSYYIKAPAILRMLQHIVGDQVFQIGTNIYLKNRSATPNDFWAAMQSAYDKASRFLSPEPRKINITEIIYPWISQNHYPVLNITCNYNNESRFIIRMKIASETWWIPLPYITRLYSNFNTLPTKVTFEHELPVHMTLKDEWIILNLQQIGYYRVNYDTENWRRIACYLNSENYQNIHVLNRAQVIDDAFYFTMTRQLDASIFWELTRYLSRETEYVAWYPMIKVLERISHIFHFPDESKYVKTIILGQLKPLLQTIKYNDQNDRYLMECLRQEAVKWACVLNDSSCKIMALNKLQRHLTDPVRHKLLPGWKKWTYCNGLSIANETVLMSVYYIYAKEIRSKKDTKLSLEFLTCSAHFYINSINMFEKIREETVDNINFFHYNVAKHAKDNSVLDHILENWEKVKPKEIKMTTALINIINNVYSKEQLDKIMDLVRNLKLEQLFINYSILESIDSMLFSKIKEYIRNNVIELISDIHNKIDVRLSQIEKQKNTFLSVFGISSAGRKIEDCNV